MTDYIDLLTRAAQKLADLTDEAAAFYEGESTGNTDRWSAWLDDMVSGPASAYIAVVGNPVVGYALAEELQDRAASLAAHLPNWRRAWNVEEQRPYTVEELVEGHHGTMLEIARTILGE